MDAPLPLGHRRRQRARAGAGAVLGALIAAALGISASRLEQRLPTVSRAQLWTGKVVRGDFVQRVQGAGVLRPEAVRWLTAESPGRVETVLVKPGTAVTVDTALVRLENLDLQLQADEALRDRQAAEAQALALEHQQAQEALRLEQEISALANDLADSTRRAAVYAEGAGLIVSRNESERERDRARALGEQVSLARGKLDLLRRIGPRQLIALQAQGEQLDRVRSVRQQMLERLLVRAPSAGTVQEILVEPGQWVVPGAPVAKLRVSERLEAVLRVPTDEVGAVRVDQRALVRTGFGRSSDGSVEGRVRRIAPTAQDSTVEVEIALEGTLPEGARADQAIDGSIETRLVPNALSLPRPVGLPLGDSVRLYRVDPQAATATRVTVTLGFVSSDTIQIIAGLNDGDEVILSDMSRHAEHDAVSLD
jgi:multidrug efflux pump subunit AcrA (membrane-fusion protein)